MTDLLHIDIGEIKDEKKPNKFYWAVYKGPNRRAAGETVRMETAVGDALAAFEKLRGL